MGKRVRPVNGFWTRHRTITVALLIGLATTLFSMLWLQNQKVITQAELRGYDTLYAIRGGQPVNLSVVIGGIDDPSLGAYTRTHAWPMPRRYIGEAINVLHHDGARTI